MKLRKGIIMKFEVELWQVILLFIMVIGYICNKLFGHESRITKTETSNSYIIHSLDELKKLSESTNNIIRAHVGQRADDKQ